MAIDDLSSRLVRDADGIHVADGNRTVSYSADGHDACFGVEDRSFWFRHRNDCIAAMVANHPYRGQLLDIGGGNGFVARRLADEGRDVVLLEPGAVGARNARLARGLEHVVCATLEDAQFRRGSFGAVGMFDVIEHIEDDRGFLRQVNGLLADGGRLYLTVPCHGWLWSKADVDAGHFRRHTQATLEALLGGLFTIDYLSYFFRPLILPQYLLRALPYRLGYGRRQVMSTAAEHGAGDGLATRMLARLLRQEAVRIRADARIGAGASCLVAATRR